MNTNTAFDQVIEMTTDIRDPHEGLLVISDLHVMKSAAGYYVGRACAEWMGDDWLPQPYCRDTEYFSTYENAEMARDAMLDLE